MICSPHGPESGQHFLALDMCEQSVDANMQDELRAGEQIAAVDIGRPAVGDAHSDWPSSGNSSAMTGSSLGWISACNASEG